MAIKPSGKTIYKKDFPSLLAPFLFIIENEGFAFSGAVKKLSFCNLEMGDPSEAEGFLEGPRTPPRTDSTNPDGPSEGHLLNYFDGKHALQNPNGAFRNSWCHIVHIYRQITIDSFFLDEISSKGHLLLVSNMSKFHQYFFILAVVLQLFFFLSYSFRCTHFRFYLHAIM